LPEGFIDVDINVDSEPRLGTAPPRLNFGHLKADCGAKEGLFRAITHSEPSI
jgi:hypothetical protein